MHKHIHLFDLCGYNIYVPLVLIDFALELALPVSSGLSFEVDVCLRLKVSTLIGKKSIRYSISTVINVNVCRNSRNEGVSCDNRIDRDENDKKVPSGKELII